MATTSNPLKFKKGKLYEVELSELVPDPRQVRKTFDEKGMVELAASVGKVGVIQPVLVRQGEAGEMVVVAGERRVEAARRAGKTTIPAILVTDNFAEIALVENLQRLDLTVIEESEGVQALVDEHQYTQEQLGEIFGKAQNTLCDILKINKLPQEVRDDCRGDRAVTRSKLLAIAKKKDAQGMIAAYNAYKAKLQRLSLPRKRKDPNEPQSVCEQMAKAVTRIVELDISAWTEDDKRNLQASLASLTTAIATCLTASAPSPPA